MTTENPKSRERYWLCPLYSFNCDCDSVDFEEGINIRRISREFVSYLDRQYSHKLKTIPSTARWVVRLPVISTNSANNLSEATRIGYINWDKVNNLLVDLMTALRLYQKGRIVAGLLASATHQNNEWSFGTSTIWPYVSSLDFFEEEPTYEFKQQDLTQVNDILMNIRESRQSGILDKIDIVLRRFHSAYHGDIEDRLIDQMIAFESLYLDSPQELTYKLRSRAAFLLRKRKDHRIIVYNNIKKAYDYRSKIVHGNNPPSRVEIGQILPKTEDYLRQSIVKFLSLLSNGHSPKKLRQGTGGKLAELDENILSNGKLLP